MKIRDIDAFFEAVDKKIETPIRVLITGGAAAILFGSARATQDIDFEVEFRIDEKKRAAAWQDLQRKLDDVARRTGISAQYADDIDRWSSILMPKKTGKLYKKIGKIELRILDPGLWAIGKLSRYLGSDIEDLNFVLGKVKPRALALAQLWGKALKMSPPSPAQSEFKRHVDDFFDSYTAQIWGRKEDALKLKEAFLKMATIRAS